MKLVIVLVILLIAGLFGMRAITQYQESHLTPAPAIGSPEDQAAAHQDFPDVPENNRFVIQTAEQTIDRFENGTGIIFLGFHQCPWCQKMAPLLNQAAEQDGANVYYLDILKLSSENPDVYQQVMAHVLPYLDRDKNGQPRLTTPDVSFVKNGKIIWRYKMDSVGEEERTPDAYWTEERKETALRQFGTQVKKMRQIESNLGWRGWLENL